MKFTDDMTTAFQNEPVNFLLSNALRHLTQDQQRELCNALQERLPIPASIEQEAERLYPSPDEAEYEKQTLLVKMATVNIQRSAHITCARQYIGEIERMGKLCMEKDGQIEALQNEIEKLRAELTKIEGIARRFGNGSDPEKDIELIETLATSALK